MIGYITIAAEVITALGVITIFVKSAYEWMHRPQKNEEDIETIAKKQEDDIKAIKSEQCMHTYVLLAILDGLKQQGCNGPVTEAKDRLQKYINKQAHDLEEN